MGSPDHISSNVCVRQLPTTPGFISAWHGEFFMPIHTGSLNDFPLLAAVGPLQFEVVQFRLESEYGATSRLESTPWTVVRWLPPGLTEEALDLLSLPTGAKLAHDMGGNPVVLFPNEWSANYFTTPNPGVTLSPLPVGLPGL